jgi:DNA repair protein RecN (Recombination protein N)
MLKSLRIKNLATIEDLELRLGEGFSVLTGETGAGKSIVIDAVRLLLGDKASPEIIRTGKTDCLIEAIFETKAIPRSALEDVPPGEEDEISIQRSVSADGPGKSYVNGVLGPVRRLRELGPALVDVYGQNDHVFLLHVENHLRYLDAFMDEPALLGDVRKTARELRSLILEKRDLEARERERDERLDFLDYQIREIEAAGLDPGEEAGLLETRAVLKNAEKIRGLLDQALDLAHEDEHSLVATLAKCQDIVAEISAFAPSFQEFRPGLEESAILIRDLADTLTRFRERGSDTPANLEDIEERLSLIDKLKRKHGGTAEGVLETLGAMQEERSALETSREHLTELVQRIDGCFLRYAELARKLGTYRTTKSGELARVIEKEISLLGMKKARFEVRLASKPLDPDDPETVRDSGTEEAEFMISPNPGEDLRPLRKIASGGELARIMLALKSVGKETEGRKTLIFDEIDSGIGGKTAESIARKLRELAGRHQVLCITHLPQIAAAASRHFLVEKKVDKDRTYTTVVDLPRNERPAEIARLISGSRVTPSSLGAAGEMLQLYAEGRPARSKGART